MVSVSEVRGKYLVVEDDGTTHGPYEDKRKAAAKYEDLEGTTTQSNQSTAQRYASKFTAGVNKAAQRAGDAGRDLANQADQAAQNAADKTFDEEEEETEQGGGPTLDSLFGGAGTESDEDDGGPSLDMFGGGGAGAELPFAQSGDEEEGDGPSLDFLGGGGGGSGPQLPGFGPPADDEEAQNPMMMGQGPDMGDLPFGRQTEEETDGDEDEYNPLQFF